MKRRTLALFAGILVLGLMPGPVLAASVVDQSNEAHSSNDGGHDLAQTVTVGQTGMLTGVDLLLYSANGWTDTVSIQSIERVSRKPTGSKLASATIWVFGEKWYHIEFPTPVSFIAGGRFAIVLSQGGNCSWGFSSGSYSAGEALEYGSAWTNLHGDANLDFAFRTYMDATPTPPSAASPTAAGPSASSATTGLTAAPTASIPSAAPTAQPNQQSGGSGDPGGLPIVIVIVGIAALALIVGGLGFALGRRRKVKPEA